MALPKKKQSYKLTLTANGKLYTAEGDTALEALEKLVPPEKLIAKGSLKVEYGQLSKSIYVPPVMMRRLFMPIARPIMAKMVGMGLK